MSVAALSFIPVREKIQKRVDRIFYREKVEPAESIFQFENNLLGIYEKEKLYPAIFNELNNIFHFSRCTVFFISGKNTFLYFKAGLEKNESGNELTIDDDLSEKLSNGKPVALH